MIKNQNEVESEGFFRLEKILQIIPISKTRWYDGIASGEFPKPVKPLGKKLSLWRKAEVLALVKSLESHQ